jgi:hypothetical protein
LKTGDCRKARLPDDDVEKAMDGFFNILLGYAAGKIADHLTIRPHQKQQEDERQRRQAA